MPTFIIARHGGAAQGAEFKPPTPPALHSDFKFESMANTSCNDIEFS